MFKWLSLDVHLTYTKNLPNLNTPFTAKKSIWWVDQPITAPISGSSLRFDVWRWMWKMTLSLKIVCSYRNRAKRNSFTILNLVFLLLKTTLDCVARIVLFSTWLYVHNEGQFSSARTVGAYYATFFVLFLFNSICNKSKTWWTRRNVTGNQQLLMSPSLKSKLSTLSVNFFQKSYWTRWAQCSATTNLTLDPSSSMRKKPRLRKGGRSISPASRSS